MNPFPRAFFRLAVCLLFAGVAARGAELLSVSTSGTNSGNAGVDVPFCVSANDRYVAFSSRSTDLVMPDTNGIYDVFVHDCVLRSNIWSTVGSLALNSAASPTPLQFTPDGRFLLFASHATNLVPNAASGISAQIYRRDLWSNETALVSVAHDGTNASSGSSVPITMSPLQPWMTADGRYILFFSAATNLVHGMEGIGTKYFAYVRDMVGGTTELVTMSFDGTALLRPINRCFMSVDGRYFAFDTSATNVAPGFTNSVFRTEVFWRDRHAGTNALVSVDANGALAMNTATLLAMTRDGRYVSFSCISTNIVPNQDDSNGIEDIFIRDMMLGETWMVTCATNPYILGNQVIGGDFSANGEWMMFSAAVGNFIPGVSDINYLTHDLYLHHLPTRTNLLVSRSFYGSTGASGDVHLRDAALSTTGRYVLFAALSTNLLPGTPAMEERLLLRDNMAGKTFAALGGSYSSVAYAFKGHSLISEDDRYVYFLAGVNYDPTLTDTNLSRDLFRARLLPAQLHLPSPGGLIQGEGIALGTYILQTSSNLTTWLNAATNTADSNGVFSVSDPQPPGPQRYFRLVTP